MSIDDSAESRSRSWPRGSFAGCRVITSQSGIALTTTPHMKLDYVTFALDQRTTMTGKDHAANLALLLSSDGDKPLIIDQPEDNLDG